MSVDFTYSQGAVEQLRGLCNQRIGQDSCTLAAMTQASEIAQDVMFARFVYQDHEQRLVSTHETGDEETQYMSVQDTGVYTPRDIAATFEQIHRLFDLAKKISEADHEKERRIGGFMIVNFSRLGERTPKPLEVRHISLNSPLTTIIAVASPFASIPVIKALVALVAEAFTLKARIHRDKAQLEAEALEYEVKGMESRKELVRLAAEVLRADRNGVFTPLPEPTELDIWHGEEPPPELELSESR